MSLPLAKKSLVIVGASCRSAAQRAALAGFDCLAIDQFSDRDLRSVAQVQRLESVFGLEESFWQPWVGAPVLLCGGMENRLELVDLLLGRGLACSNSSTGLASLRDIDAWARWSNAAGIGWPETRTWLDARNAGREEGRLGPQRWLAKSRNGAGGMGVRAWRGERIEPFEYLQQAIEGEVLGVTFLAGSEKTWVVGCMRSWPGNAFWGPSPFLYRGSVGPIRLAIEEWSNLMRFANGVQRETGLRGLWQADFVRNRDGWWLLEINPRWSSSMELLEVAYDISLVDQHVFAQTWTSEAPIATSAWDRFEKACMAEVPRVIGKVVRYAVEDLRPTPTMLDRWWGHRWDGAAASLQIENRIADIPGDANIIPMGYPVCSEFALGGSIAEVQMRLDRSVLVQGP